MTIAKFSAQIAFHIADDYASWFLKIGGRMWGGFWPSHDFCYRRRIGVSTTR